MKLLEIAGLQFLQDNPGGEWLQDKRKYNDEDGTNEFGAPRGWGSITGHFSRNVLLPVSVVKNLPGRRGEHLKTREDDLNSLLEYMREHNTLPSLSNGKDPYCPYIEVWQNGDPWINEGNHRIKAAAILEWKFMPITLRYFSGGEDEPGPLTPQKIKMYDAQALAEGYTPGEGFKGLI